MKIKKTLLFSLTTLVLLVALLVGCSNGVTNKTLTVMNNFVITINDGNYNTTLYCDYNGYIHKDNSIYDLNYNCAILNWSDIYEE